MGNCSCCPGIKARDRLAAEIESKGETVVELSYGVVTGGCVFKGKKSSGVWQGKGNGVLAVSDRSLYFRGFVLTDAIDIDLAEVTSVKTANSFKETGVLVTSPAMVIVTWSSRDGADDAAAWQLPPGGAEKWRTAIERQAALRKKDG